MQIIELLKDIVSKEYLFIDEPMKNHTSFKVGGPADFLVIPTSVEKLTGILELCKNENIPFFVMGNGTNLIIRDKGIRGIVIKIFNCIDKYSVKDDIIEAEAGILLSKLSNIAMENGLSGLEFASGIPGTFGGAVTMNAGAYIGEMKDIVIETEYMDMNGLNKKVYGEQHCFSYRTSFIQKSGGILLRSKVKLKKGNVVEIKSLMDDLNRRRRDKQPLELPSAGSVFKRPEGFYAGKLIEDCNLKGYKIGGAEVSEKHSGFLVNKNNASASDIISLIKYIQSTVKSKFGVDLQTEVKIVGEE